MEEEPDEEGAADEEDVDSPHIGLVALHIQGLIKILPGCEDLKREVEEKRGCDHHLAQQQRSSGDGRDDERRNGDFAVLREQDVAEDANQQVDDDFLEVGVNEDAVDCFLVGRLRWLISGKMN